MPHRHAYHATRWFGLPGMFMAGILCGALIAAAGYSRHGAAGPAFDRQLRSWLDTAPDNPSRHRQSGERLVGDPVRMVSI
jgi:hypothetical protein